MAVVPLTIIISLCLVFTFVLFFLHEHLHQGFGGAESESLLPLAGETPRLAHHEYGAEDDACGCRSGVRPPCAGCRKIRSVAPVTSQA